MSEKQSFVEKENTRPHPFEWRAKYFPAVQTFIAFHKLVEKRDPEATEDQLEKAYKALLPLMEKMGYSEDDILNAITKGQSNDLGIEYDKDPYVARRDAIKTLMDAFHEAHREEKSTGVLL
jgi:hypothetical protein